MLYDVLILKILNDLVPMGFYLLDLPD